MIYVLREKLLSAEDMCEILPLTVAYFALQLVWKWYGWRWTNTHSRGHCDINWFDVKPRPNDNGYDDYVRDVAVLINGRTSFYRGFLVPPSPEEHLRMCMNEYGKRVREVG